MRLDWLHREGNGYVSTYSGYCPCGYGCVWVWVRAAYDTDSMRRLHSIVCTDDSRRSAYPRMYVWRACIYVRIWTLHCLANGKRASREQYVWIHVESSAVMISSWCLSSCFQNPEVISFSSPVHTYIHTSIIYRMYMCVCRYTVRIG